VDLYNVVPRIEKDTENNLDRISYIESILEDLESKMDSLKLSLNNNEEKIKNLELKTKDFSIAELFKGVGSSDGPIKNDISFELLKSLEKKFDSKMKLNDEKISKLDENNFKLTRQIQNVKNSQDLVKRNIDTFAKIPNDRIVIETDSPFCAPVPHRGKMCERAFVIETARVLAEIKHLQIDELEFILMENTKRLYPKIKLIQQ
jgi:hypothetical protein